MPSIRHYLVIAADSRRVVHFERDASDAPRAAIVPLEASLALDPPGIEVEIAAYFEDR